MGEKRQVLVDGERVTIGECEDPKWQNCYFACFGSSNHHVTYIVHAHTGQIQAIFTRGNERRLMGLWLIALSQ